MIKYYEVAQSLVAAHPFITAAVLSILAIGLMWWAVDQKGE
jgi:uncharacterized membrane protein YhfC